MSRIRPEKFQGETEEYEPPQKVTAIDLWDFLELKISPRDWLLRHILQTQSLVMIFGEAGVGKTLLMLSMAYAIASGGDFLRFKTQRPHKVLYLDGEMQGGMMQDRLRMVVSAFEDKAPKGYFRLVTPHVLESGMPDLSTADGQDAIGELIEDAEVIFVDSVSTLCRSGTEKENEAGSWLPIQDWALRMRREGRAVVFGHHSGKSGDQRGTTQRLVVLDNVVKLTRPKGYSQEDGARFVFTYTKSRGLVGEPVRPFAAWFKEVDKGSGREKWTMQESDEALIDVVLELFEEGKTTKQVAKELGISESKAHRLKVKGEKSGGRRAEAE
jgi:hypothetical protein